jgi:3-oxoacyl-[acyl-carrier-protein] synthase II
VSAPPVHDVMITGIGLVTAMGEGADANYAALNGGGAPTYDRQAMAPFAIHAQAPLDYDKLIPKRTDQRQMEFWQRLGVFAAGLALRDGGVLGNMTILPKIHMIAAAGGGERDIATDEEIMTGIRTASDRDAYLNAQLSKKLRPTLFLAQLPNLLAGNISIVHGVAGSSRTFMGEEAAGLDALGAMVARIGAGEVDIGLVGGAFSALRPDLALVFGFAGSLLSGEPTGVWSRAARGGGMILGSVGAFLLLESRSHALARGAPTVAIVGPALSDRSSRAPGAAGGNARKLWTTMKSFLAPGPVGILSGATGVAPITAEERSFLDEAGREHDLYIRATGARIGHSLEATVPANVGLAAVALRKGGYFPPFEPGTVEREAAKAPSQIVVTSFGHWRGEGMVLVRRDRGGQP